MISQADSKDQTFSIKNFIYILRSENKEFKIDIKFLNAILTASDP